MAEERITYMNKAELLERIPKDRAAFAALWQPLTDDQMIARPGPQEDWSVKDLIAHMTWWERSMMRNTQKLRNDDPIGPRPSIDAINVTVFEENKDRPLDDVIAEFNQHEVAVLAHVQSLSDAEINKKRAFKDGEITILDFIIGDTFGHYAAHTPDLVRYIQSVANV